MNNRTVVLAFSCFSFVSLCPRASFADDPHAEIKRQEAEASSAFERGDFGRAADEFAEAYRLDPEAKVLWNLAIAEYKAGRAFLAIKHLREYEVRSDANPKNRDRARPLLEELAAKIGHVIVSAPADAQVILDGMPVGKAPLTSPIEVDPDVAHSVVVTLGGGEARQEIAPPGPREVRVQLNVPERVPLLETRSPEPESPRVHDRTTTAPLRIWMTVGLSAGAIALAAGGVYTGMQSSSAKDDVARMRGNIPASWCHDLPTNPGCADIQSALSSQDSNHVASIVLYSGAGLLAAGAVASWFFLPHTRTVHETATATPMVGPGSLGLSVSGSF
jgi:hypothetical protein